MSTSLFFGDNLVGQDPWARRGENDARLSSLETSRTADEATLATINTGVWTDYSTVLTQGGTVTYTRNYCRYNKIGRQVTVSFDLEVTGAGSANNAIKFTLPFEAVFGIVTGVVLFYDSSAAAAYLTHPNLVAGSITIGGLWPAGSVITPAFLGGSASPFGAALASPDIFRATLTYEAMT